MRIQGPGKMRMHYFSCRLFFINSTEGIFGNTSEICLIRMTFFFASHLIFKIEAFKKHVLVHQNHNL